MALGHRWHAQEWQILEAIVSRISFIDRFIQLISWISFRLILSQIILSQIIQFWGARHLQSWVVNRHWNLPVVIFHFCKLDREVIFWNLCLPVISFQGQTTDAFVESFKSPLAKAKTIAMFVLFKFQTYSIFCLTKFPRNIYIQKRAEPPESEKPNGPSIEGERGKVQNLNSMKWLLDRAALARPGNDGKEETLASDRLSAAPTRAREEEGLCLPSRIMGRLLSPSQQRWSQERFRGFWGDPS